MKLLLITQVFLLALLGSISMSFAAETDAQGLFGGKLAKCPSKPNCICSEHAKDSKHHAAPIQLKPSQLNNAITEAKSVIESMGGIVTSQQATYLAATFTNDWFKFVDDLELRVDSDNSQLHIRSASRTGYHDMGVNSKRVKEFTKLFQNSKQHI